MDEEVASIPPKDLSWWSRQAKTIEKMVFSNCYLLYVVLDGEETKVDYAQRGSEDGDGTRYLNEWAQNVGH